MGDERINFPDRFFTERKISPKLKQTAKSKANSDLEKIFSFKNPDSGKSRGKQNSEKEKQSKMQIKKNFLHQFSPAFSKNTEKYASSKSL